MGTSASSRPPSAVSSRSKVSLVRVRQADPKAEIKTLSPRKQQKDQTNEQKKVQPQGKDVMISYSHADSKIMKVIKDTLEEAGITVWVDVTNLASGDNFLSKIGQAVIDCKLFISLLSEHNLKSRCCQDELALAYVSNKPIYPISLQTPQELMPLMDTGMRLQLARFDWFLLTNPDTFDTNMQDFVKQLKGALEERPASGNAERAQDDKTGSASSQEARPTTTRRRLNRQKSKMDLFATGDSGAFWELHFNKEGEAPWEAFTAAFKKDYQERLQTQYGITDPEWLLGLLKRELDVGDDQKVKKDLYQDFLTVDGELKTLWSRIQEQATESYSMHEVFNMDSSVRVEAIENLGRFHSKAVVEALMDLLDEKENNVKTVAAISLAKTGYNSKAVITKLMTCLESQDRLVRESGCLALGKLRAKEAVPKLVDLWRNDVISSVREACQVALEQIGGEEAKQAIHITNLLASEIRSLTQQ